MAVLLLGSLAAFIGLEAAGIEWPSALAVGLACGIAGAVVEAFSTHGLDNFTTQVAAAAAAFFLL
jgi:phytol kinase